MAPRTVLKREHDIMKLKQIAADLFCGLLCAACPVLFSAAAFPGKLPVTAAAAGLTVPLCTLLLRTKTRTSRRVRSITAAAAFLPMMWASIRYGIHNAVYKWINPAYIREFGKPNVGDAAGLILIWFPASVILLLLSVFLASRMTKQQEQQTSFTEEAKP